MPLTGIGGIMLVPPPVSGGGGGGFTPPAGLAGWWKADDATKLVTQATDDGLSVDGGAPVDGHFVYTWSDSNGGAIEWGPNNGNSPTYVANGINGLPSLSFSSLKYLSTLQIASLGLTAAEAFIVTKRALDNSNWYAVWQLGSSPSDNWFPFADRLYEDFGSTTRRDMGTVPDLSTQHVYNPFADGSGVGVEFDDGTPSTAAGNTVGWRAESLLGTSGGMSSWYNGLIGEILFFDHVLSSGDRTAVVDYLRAKWGTP